MARSNWMTCSRPSTVPTIDCPDQSESGITANGGLEEKHAPGEHSLRQTILASGLSLDAIEAMVLREAVDRSEGNLAGGTLAGHDATTTQLPVKAHRTESSAMIRPLCCLRKNSRRPFPP
jgi:hypothetical protein